MTETIVEIRNVSKRFWRRTALDHVTLKIRRGAVHGLVGENGAGKTTLIRHLLGLFKPQTGSVSVFGLDPVSDPPGVLSRIGYLSENRELPEWIRVAELMAYIQAFFPQWDEAFAAELCDTFELARDQKIKTLSRGQRARAGLLIALAHRPELLILDEPSSGLDPIVRRDILTAIIRTVAEEGRTVLFSSHLLDEVERVAGDVTMLHQGRIVFDDELNRILDTHHLLTLRFAQAVAARPQLPGALAWSGEGIEWTCVCNCQFEQLQQAAENAGAAIVERRRPNLEQVFLARAQGRGAEPERGQ